MPRLNESFPQSLSRVHRPVAIHGIIGKGYKNPIALSRNFEDTSWWWPACHKPDLPSGFVKFMRIGETVYGAWKGETALFVDGGKREEVEGGRRAEGVGGRREVLGSRVHGTARIV